MNKRKLFSVKNERKNSNKNILEPIEKVISPLHKCTIIYGPIKKDSGKHY